MNAGTLVVCYSNTGVSRRAAQLLCSMHDWPLGEVRDSGQRGVLRCVLDSLLRRQPAISYDGPPPGNFQTVVLVAPIWMGRLAGPMRSFVSRYERQLPRVVFVATMNSGGEQAVFHEVADRLGHPLFASAAFRQREIEDGSGTTRLLTFADSLA